jgi:hypothetical protein
MEPFAHAEPQTHAAKQSLKRAGQVAVADPAKIAFLAET